MKNTKLFATLGAVALVAAVGLGSTLAYLSDTTDTVTNKFTLGSVDFDEDMAGGKKRTYYRLTEAGREHYRAKCEEWTLTKEVIEKFIADEGAHI